MNLVSGCCSWCQWGRGGNYLFRGEMIPTQEVVKHSTQHTMKRSSSSDFDDASRSRCLDENVNLIAPHGKVHDGLDDVQEASKFDTRRVAIGKIAVLVALLVTASIVTVTSFVLLQKEEQRNFDQAFEQFSRNLGDAAIAQQLDIRKAYTGLANLLAGFAQSENKTWPLHTIPLFETYARDTRAKARAELLMLINYVTHDEREDYERYVNTHYEDWVAEGHLLENGNLDRLNPVGYHDEIVRATSPGVFVSQPPEDSYLPTWLMSPPPLSYGLVNVNMAYASSVRTVFAAVVALKNETLLSAVRPYTGAKLIYKNDEEHAAKHPYATVASIDLPHGVFLHPVHERVRDFESPIVSFLLGNFAWDAALQHLLPEGVEGIIAVIQNTCNQSFTFVINGPKAIYIGEGDVHETRYQRMKVFVDLALHTNPDFATTPGHCRFSMSLYPSSKFESAYKTNVPAVFGSVVAATFVLVGCIFLFYHWIVEKRNDSLVRHAARTGAIVTSLFPTEIRDRLLQEATPVTKHQANLKSFLASPTSDAETIDLSSKPLADLFLETTVMFGDIVGFTAWSSVREPSQVFTLLETVYSGFDSIAKMRRVFKVETVGDCYVAVAGLPEPRKDHAVVMARFARDCMVEMRTLAMQLEVRLGPDTADLSMRIGLHSGPVTAGVLRGERSRFQLFGDTMNTASRMESTSARGCIQVSQETADLLSVAGKGHWLNARKGLVFAKGKGSLSTHWLTLAERDQQDEGGSPSDVTASTDLSQDPSEQNLALEETSIVELSDKARRLVSWNVELLLRLLQQIIARRTILSRKPSESPAEFVDGNGGAKESTVLDEVLEIISLPQFDSAAAQRQEQWQEVEVAPQVLNQLEDYVTCIAAMYRSNPFHNFDHASHVVMSVSKLMSRIIAPDQHEEPPHSQGDNQSNAEWQTAASLHDHTYGITSDPLTQFACAFSALIHDVDHTGAPNAQLIKENASVAAMYKNRSVAEQNSFDISWSLLMDQRYKDLRSSICSSDEELSRFRQLVVNSVMATDIVDKDLKKLRNKRWDKAFTNAYNNGSEAPSSWRGSLAQQDNVNRKATIVIEHLIQASDVAHTMQHWHIYRKWNEALFREMYLAYKSGRADKNPADFWYQGELGFFDFYIIPLAKKLKNCGVFGVSSDEYLIYASKNRDEWRVRGQEVVGEMLEKISKEPCIESDRTKRAMN